MLLRRVLPDDGAPAIDHAEADDQLSEWYAPHGESSMRLMMIATLDGRTVGADGISDSISSPVDRRVLAAVRRHADAVIVGAGTVRREDVGRPRGAALVVVTGSGALEGHRLREADDGAPLLVMTTPRGAERAAATLARIPHEIVTIAVDDNEHPRPDAVVGVLRRRGYRHLVCEGGPTLAAGFLAAELFDEVCLTSAPALGGGARLFGEDEQPVRALHPRQLIVDAAGFTYGRWRPLSPAETH